MVRSNSSIERTFQKPLRARPSRLVESGRRQRLIVYFSLVFVLCFGSDIIHAARFDFDATPGRLSKDVVPTHYQLDFDLDPSRATFSGHVDIDLTVRKPVAEIVLQATELVARRVVLRGESGSTRELIVAPDKANHLWRLSWLPRDTLPPGKWRLSIDYDGKVEQRGQGLYRVDYRSAGESEAQQRMLATQLEPTHARAVFPSFDEPAFRATFGIAITAPSGFTSVSNMPVASQVLLDNGASNRIRAYAFDANLPLWRWQSSICNR